MFNKIASAALVVALSSSLAYAAPTATGSSAPAEPVVSESYEVAGTVGMDRRGDRRDTRQDCRQSEGLAGADKRDCKQDGRTG